MNDGLLTPRLPRAVCKLFDGPDEAMAEMEALATPEERTEMETGLTVGAFNPKLALTVGLITGKLLYVIISSDVEVIGEAHAHGWITFDNSLMTGDFK